MLQQTSIFDFINHTPNTYKINKPIRLIELFAGIGSQAKALKNIGADFEHYKVVEFDKNAIASYNAIHGTNFVTQDITKIKGSDLEIVDTNKYCYIMTYSFPCQDLSLAGKQAGMTKGSSTRSGLLWEVERLLNETKELPQILLMENVPQIHGKKNIQDFEKWIELLQSKGYSNYWKDLNAKDYGIPQNRNRTFMVSILGSYEYDFPKPFELKLRLKDMLEENVDEKYYLSDKNIKYICDYNEVAKNKGRNVENAKINTKLAKTISCRGVETTQRADVSNYIVENCEEEILVKDLKEFIKYQDCRNMKEKLCDDLINKGSVKENDIIRHSYTSSRIKGEMDSVLENNISPTLDTRCDCLGVVVLGNYSPSNHNASRIVDSSGIAPTVMENHGTVTATYHNLRIRKLTPKECWRLMGFADEDFDNASNLNSSSQLYKQAGNSIVVNVLEAIFKELL